MAELLAVAKISFHQAEVIHVEKINYFQGRQQRNLLQLHLVDYKPFITQSFTFLHLITNHDTSDS